MQFTISDYDARGAYLLARTVVGVEQDACWLWRRALDRDGYGVATFRGKQWRAHRLSYTHYVGPIPDGLELDHVCEQRRCVRPSHLQPVTNFENFVRKYLRQGRTREDAEQIATFDIERIEREHSEKVRNRLAATAKTAAETLATSAGVGVGSLVRRGKGKKAASWIVRDVGAVTRGDVYILIESTATGYDIIVPLESVTPP